MKKHIAAAIFILTLLLPLPLQAAPTLTLPRAKELAQTEGAQLRRARLEYEQSSADLAATRKELGLGSVTSESLQQSLDHLDLIVSEAQNAIDLLQENIFAWEEELKEAAEADKIKLQRNIEQAEEEMEKYKQEIRETNEERSKLLLVMPQLKDREEDLKQYVDPLETLVDLRQDALIIQPKTVDYLVESTYFKILMLEQQQNLLRERAAMLEKLVKTEKLKQELGLATSLQVKDKEEELLQAENDLKQIEAELKKAKRELNREAGLPLDFQFSVSPYPIGAQGDGSFVLSEMPDFTTSVLYRRALDTVNKRQKDLDDIKDDYSKREKKELARKNLELAQLELEETLTNLEANFKSALEQLKLAASELEEKKLSLEQAKKKTQTARLQHELGLISDLELKGIELSLLQAEAAHYAAEVGKHLAYQAYLLALEGIPLQY